MAKRVMTTIVDDTDGSDAALTVTFALEGALYEIDLSEVNADKLRAAIEPWAQKGRRTGGRKKNSAVGPSTSERREHLAKIREWAHANGHEVGAKGRIAQDVQDAYAAAQ